MGTRPEGLSPCYYSLASPDIPASHKFRWTSRISQTSYTIRIYASDKITLLATYSATSTSNEIDMGSVGYVFQLGTIYYWTITTANSSTTSEVSVMAKFIYASSTPKEAVTWSGVNPKTGEVIKNGGLFTEIKNNLTKVINDYSTPPSIITKKLNELFTGKVVPARKDFKNLQDLLQYVGGEEGIIYKRSGLNVAEVRPNRQPLKWEVSDGGFSVFSDQAQNMTNTPRLEIEKWVHDSLGVSDLLNVKKYIDMILNVPPEPMKAVVIDANPASMYGMTSLSATSDGKLDATIAVSWGSNNIPNQTGALRFNELSPNDDVRFYECQFGYGPSAKFKSTLFFRPSDFSTENWRSFDTDWNGLYVSGDLSLAKHEFKVVAVDYKNNCSKVYSVVKTYGTNFKTPIGVNYYEVQAQKRALTASAYDANGSWSGWLKTTSISSTYTASGSEGKYWYRARVIDKSGLVSGWVYSGAITWDPLTPPATPGNFRVTSKGTTNVNLDWDSSARAENYELYMWITPGTQKYYGTATAFNVTGLNPNSSYNFYVRAHNRVGSSAWTSLTVKTNDNIHEKTWNSVHSHSWRDNWGWRADQGLNHTNVYQGEWQNYGNHRGLWYFDHSDIWNSLAGKQILEVWVEVTRVRGGYSTANAARFWTHKKDYTNGDTPYLWGPASDGTIRTPGDHNHSYEFTVGQKKWVRLPNSYGERLRDQHAKGIAIYEPDGKPYLIFDNNARLYIKYKG